MESPSSTKLRQAQLPFFAIKNVSPTPAGMSKKKDKDDKVEDKENVSAQASYSAHQHKTVKTPETAKPVIVDLTENDPCSNSGDEIVDDITKEQLPFSSVETIERVIDAVVKRASEASSLEMFATKKRRKMSPLLATSDAKRVLCEENGRSISALQNLLSRDASPNTGHAAPKIIVTPPTPIRMQKSLFNEFFHKLLDNPTKQTQGYDDKSSECNPIVNMAKSKRQRSKSHGDEAEQLDREDCKAKYDEKPSKYPPLSSILGKKRPRSKSPVTLKSGEDVARKVVVNPEGSVVATKKPKEDETKIFTTEESDLDAVKQKETSPVKVASEIINLVDDNDELSSCKEEEEKENLAACEPSVTPISEKKPDVTTSGTSTTPLQEVNDKKKRSPKFMTKCPRNLEAMRLKKAEKEKEKEQKKKIREEQQLAREREKLEVMRKKEEEKARKEDERRKKKEEEEAAKADRQRKLDEKRLEKEKMEREKKLEKERKDEEKRKERERKEEEKRQKELEKQKIEREKQEAEEQKRRKSRKHAELFKSFFKSPARSPPLEKSVHDVGIFAPFQLKQDMMLAPMRRAKIDSDEKKRLDMAMEAQDVLSPYLKDISSKPRKMSSRTMPRIKRKLVSLAEDGLELIEDSDDGKPGVRVLRAKFLSFHTNYRPPYYGTWRKESKVLSYKNPLKKDNDLFDYEFDSDDEWEEPAEGEDIANSDGEDEGDANEEDEDDGFFVPHGYLSDDEGINEEGEEDGMKPDHKLKQKQLEFEASFKRKLSHLTPIIVGCIWKDSAQSLDKVHREMLNSYKPEFLRPPPIEIQPPNKIPEKLADSPADGTKSDQTKKGCRLKTVPEEAMPDLIRLLHGNGLSLSRIVHEFITYWKVKKGSSGPIDYGPMSLEEPMATCDKEEEEMEIDAVPAESCPPKPDDASASDLQLPAEVALMESNLATPKPTEDTHQISKSQMNKKCKEIATYLRKENMNRACWFVNDSVLETYGMTGDKAPVPCKWKYLTEVPKVQILMFPQLERKATTLPAEATVVPRQSPSGSNIAKFAAKLSPKVILEQCKLRHEKERQLCTTASPISRFTTEKMSPIAIIEESAQKIAQDLKAKATKDLQTEKATKNPPAPSQPQDGNFVIPTPEAMKSFFHIVDLTADVPGEGSD